MYVLYQLSLVPKEFSFCRGWAVDRTGDGNIFTETMTTANLALHSISCGVEQHVREMYRLVEAFSPFSAGTTFFLAFVTVLTAIQVVQFYYSTNRSRGRKHVYWRLNASTTEHFIWRDDTSVPPENHLMNAILLYTTQKLWKDHPLSEDCYASKALIMHFMRPLARWDNELDVKMSKSGVPVRLPLFPFWLPVHYCGIEISYNYLCSTRFEEDKVSRVVYLRTPAATSTHGVSPIRSFLDEALKFYIEGGYYEGAQARCRLYQLYISAGQVRVMRHDLSSRNSLQTIYFPQKKAVMLLIWRFLHRRGRFAIPFFPWKLGLLLYGPRGAGKRSFIKALATETRRDIVAVPLSQYQTNEQLRETFFLEGVKGHDDSDLNSLSQEKVIFVIDEVDTSSTSSLVRARAPSEHKVRFRRTHGLRLSHGDAAEMTDAVLVPFATPSVLNESQSPRDSPKLKKLTTSKNDVINLSTLLNLLDGVVDTPGRIVVMLVDHPERLDPALTRPGRLTTPIRFDYIVFDDLVALSGLFFGELFVEKTDVEIAPNAEDADVKFDEDCFHWRDVIRGDLLHCITDERPLRRMSARQEDEMRQCILSLEKEEKALMATPRKSQSASRRYEFMITASHVHQLCMISNTLSEFLHRLTQVIRNGGAKEPPAGNI